MIDSLKWIKSEMKTIYSVISVRVVIIGHEMLRKKDSTKISNVIWEEGR
jgi:hypothetical protein